MVGILGLVGSVGVNNIISIQEIPFDANFAATSTTVSLDNNVIAANCFMTISCHNDGTTGNKTGDHNLCNVQLSNTQLTINKDATNAGTYVYTAHVLELDPAVIAKNEFVSAVSGSTNGYIDVTLASNIGNLDNVFCSHHGHDTDETNNYIHMSQYAKATSVSNLRLGISYTGIAATKVVRGQVLEIVR